MMKCMTKSTKLCLLTTVSVTGILFGSILLASKDNIFKRILDSQLIISPGTAAFNAWVETPIPVYTKFYFFDMLNPSELFHSHELPILEERGPYTFREVEKKVNLVWNEDGTVSYKRKKFWYFEREMSVGPLTDVVTTINVPVVGSAEFVRGDFFLEWGVSDMLSTIQAKIFVKKTVGELLFEGYDDTIMEIAGSLDEEDEFEYYDDEEKEKSMNKFGWFYERNGTSWSDGDLVMNTGKDDISLLGQIVSWNGENKTDAYEGNCAKVRGSSDGLLPPGFATTVDSFNIFSTDLCRPLTFSRTGDHTVHGIPVQKFELSVNNFANTSVHQKNSCYNNNIPTGVQNVTHCKVKSPTFVSQPHFHLADSSYADQFQFGIQDKSEGYESAFWIEPMSSIPIKVEMRLQLNILLDKVEGIEYLFKNLQHVMFPVMWFESKAELPSDMTGALMMLVIMPGVMLGCGLFSLCCGVLILISLFLCKVNRERRKKAPKNDKLPQCDYEIAGPNQ